MPAQGTVLQFRPPVDYGDGGPHEVINGVAPSSFGMAATTLGPGYCAAALVGSFRRMELEFRENFYKCKQHDWKSNNFNGSAIPSGNRSMVQPLLSSNAARPSYWVPLDSRRPSNPYRIGRKIVGAFTNMLFSHGRWPQMRSSDPDTQAWAESLVKAANLVVQMILARNSGGGCGVVGLSWGWFDGKPRVKVHEGKNLTCLEWEDEDELKAAHVTEIWTFTKVVPDPKTGKPVEKAFYHRRDWTQMADVVFRDVPVPDNKDEEPDWAAYIDQNATNHHQHGVIHFEWIANLPDDDVDSCDGQPDYAQTYEQQNTLDTLNSIVPRGAILNLDPTLVLKVDPDIVGGVVQKGSEHALTVGIGGDASYLELAGTSIDAGQKLIEAQKQQILEVCECVLTDPDKAAAAGTSSVALKVIYAPMIAKCDVLRMTYGRAIERILNGLTDFARRHLPDFPGQRVVAEPEDEDVPVDENGDLVEPEGEPVEEELVFYANLPPREQRVDVIGPDGKPTGEQQVESTDQVPGRGQISLEWGDYFKPTADDQQKTSAALNQAVGGKAVMSQRTAVEMTANIYNRDPNAEWIEVSKENREQAARESVMNTGMFPPTGGADALPPEPSGPPASPIAPNDEPVG